MAFKKYNLTQTQLKKLARLCVQEQGSIAGVKAEASLMANLLETNITRQKKFGTDGNGLCNWVRNGGWFYRAGYFMDNGTISNKYVEAVKDVLVNGNRTLPQYIDEHDCFNDIKSISTGSIRNRADYVKGETIIKNKMGSTYTFYCFPDKGSDPFGYTKDAYDYVMKHGGEEPEETTRERATFTASLPEISQGDSGDAVKLWQVICGAGVDGDFGVNTAKATVTWQRAHNLAADGIVGAKSWQAGLNEIN